MLEKLKGLIADFMEEQNLNTHRVRVLIKEGGKSPFGASINTINEIIKKDKLPKSRETMFKILDSIEAEYEVDSIGNINLL